MLPAKLGDVTECLVWHGPHTALYLEGSGQRLGVAPHAACPYMYMGSLQGLYKGILPIVENQIKKWKIKWKHLGYTMWG